MRRRGLAYVVSAEEAAAQRQRRQQQADLSNHNTDDKHRMPEDTKTGSGHVPMESQMIDNPKCTWFVAVDLGTTHTAVAWHRSDMPITTFHTVDNMPGVEKMARIGNQIKSALWYPDKSAQPDPALPQSEIRIRFGEEVQELLTMPNTFPIRKIYEPSGRIDMLKLLLNHSEYAQEAKDELKKILGSLKVAGHIEKDEQVIFDFILEILRATQVRLRTAGLEADSKVEVIFCVPICWKPSAAAVICSAFESAMKRLQFGTNGVSPCQLFIVHEAEAHAIHAVRYLADVTMRNDTFMLMHMDCGGGTTDIGIYSVTRCQPLRFDNEVHEAYGTMVGAGDLNARFRQYVKDLLQVQHNYQNLDRVIEGEIMGRFENQGKRIFADSSCKMGFWCLLYGLRESKDDKRIQEDGFYLDWDDMWEIFRPTVVRIGKMMLDQIIQTEEARYKVDTIVVVGGFGDSLCLREYLTEKIDAHNNNSRHPVRLCFPARERSATGVAVGAILRAVDKTGGPSRITSQSVGVLRHVPANDRGSYSSEVRAQSAELDDEDGHLYIWDTIEWKVIKGTRVDAVYELSFITTHSFRENQEWVVEEVLFASEECTESFFKRNHRKNNGKVAEIGRVEFDLRHMKYVIQQTNLSNEMLENSVEIRVEMRVIDRNIEFAAFWPASPGGQEIYGSRRYFSVASAFMPGTQ